METSSDESTWQSIWVVHYFDGQQNSRSASSSWTSSTVILCQFQERRAAFVARSAASRCLPRPCTRRRGQCSTITMKASSISVVKLLLFQHCVLVVIGASESGGTVRITSNAPLSDQVHGEYLVKFRDDAGDEFKAFVERRRDWNMKAYNVGTFMGVFARLDDAQILDVQRSPGVEIVEPNVVVQTFHDFVHGDIDDQRASPEHHDHQQESLLGEQIVSAGNIGLDRIDQRILPLDNVYRWNDEADGTGSHIYIIDSGLDSTHPEFEGRASYDAYCLSGDGCHPGPEPRPYAMCMQPFISTDITTPVASIAGGKTYGVAKNATLHGICISHHHAPGLESILRAIEYVVNDQVVGPKIIALCVAGSQSDIWDSVVNAAFDAGALSIVSGPALTAPRNNACDYSPSSAKSAFVLGGVDRNDGFRYFSRGPCIDLCVPSDGIRGVRWFSELTYDMQGPYGMLPLAAGAAALVASREPPSAWDPQKVKDILIAEATPDVLSNMPDEETPNLMLFTTPRP